MTLNESLESGRKFTHPETKIVYRQFTVIDGDGVEFQTVQGTRPETGEQFVVPSFFIDQIVRTDYFLVS